MDKKVDTYTPTDTRKKISKHMKKLNSYSVSSKVTINASGGFGKHLVDGSSSPYEVVSELLFEMNKKFKECNECLENNSVAIAKINASRAGTIATVLLRSLDKKEGGQLAEDLESIYAHILIAVKNFIKDDDKKLLKSATFASKQILEGWQGIKDEVAA